MTQLVYKTKYSWYYGFKSYECVVISRYRAKVNTSEIIYGVYKLKVKLVVHDKNSAQCD